MKKKSLIIGAVIAVVLVAAGVSAAVIHNQQVERQKIALAKANESKWLKEANTAVDKAYQTKKSADINSAKTAVKKLNSTDQKAPLKKLTTLTSALSDLTSTDKLVAAAEKAKSDAEAKLEQAKKDAQAKIDAQKMDLNAIANGDYSSIQGTWTGKSQYGSTFTVSVSGNNISVSYGSSNFIPEKFTMNHPEWDKTGSSTLQGALFSEYDVNNHIDFLAFVPKGIDTSQWPHNGTSSDINLDRLMIDSWGSGTGVLIKTNDDKLSVLDSLTVSESDQAAIDKVVKAAQTSLDKISLSAVATEKTALQKRLNTVSGNTDTSENSTSETQASPAMNLDQIANGDFSSIQGTWKNGEGKTLIVKDKTMTFEDAYDTGKPLSLTVGEDVSTGSTGPITHNIWPMETAFLSNGILKVGCDGAYNSFMLKGTNYQGAGSEAIQLQQDAISGPAQYSVQLSKLYYRVNS